MSSGDPEGRMYTMKMKWSRQFPVYPSLPLPNSIEDPRGALPVVEEGTGLCDHRGSLRGPGATGSSGTTIQTRPGIGGCGPDRRGPRLLLTVRPYWTRLDES